MASLLAASILFAGAQALAATHLIAVGNNQGRPDEPNLRFAERDAQEFSNVLARLGRVSAEDTRLLLGEDADSFRRVLLNANVRLRSGPNEPGGSALLIYYSGHADASGLHLGNTVLPYEELRALVEGSPAQIRLLIIDSCQSGGITQIKGARPAEPFAIQIEQRLDAEGFAIITSSAGTEDSQESETLRASFFTHHFVTALRGAADLDHDGRVTLNEAYAYAHRGTLYSSGRTTKLQHPTYLYELKGKSDFVLTFPGAVSAQFGLLSIPATGSYLVLEGGDTGLVAADMIVEQEGTHLLLPPGRYVVRRRADTYYREYGVELSAGREIDLDRVAYQEITYARLLRKGGGARESFHSVSISAGIESPMASGYTPSKMVAAGYAIDFPWITLGAEALLGFASAESQSVKASGREIGLRIRAERFVDLSIASLALGLLAEGSNFHETFTTAGDAPSRSAWTVGFGGLFAIERTVTAELALRLQLAIVTHIVPSATLDGGAAVSKGLETPLGGSISIGGRYSL